MEKETLNVYQVQVKQTITYTYTIAAEDEKYAKVNAKHLLDDDDIGEIDTYIITKETDVPIGEIDDKFDVDNSFWRILYGVS